MNPIDSRVTGVPSAAAPAGLDIAPPVGLRVAAVVGIVGSIVALATLVASVPAASRAWDVLSQETERTLAPVLGEPEHQTLKMLASLVGSDLDETLSASSPTPH